MEYRFLSGEDQLWVDYGQIDADVDGQLDDHWATQINQDCQDEYFDKWEEDDDDLGPGQASGVGADQAMQEGEYDY